MRLVPPLRRLAGLRNQMGVVFRPDPRRAARNIRSNTAWAMALVMRSMMRSTYYAKHPPGSGPILFWKGARLGPARRSGTESSQPLRWRETDSNHRPRRQRDGRWKGSARNDRRLTRRPGLNDPIQPIGPASPFGRAER